MYAVDVTNEEAFYITDYFPTCAGKIISSAIPLSSRGLHRIISCVVEGLLELRNACDRPHGNLKPNNVLLRGSGYYRGPQVALTDPAGSSSSSLSITSEADDMYALGALLFELVNRRKLRPTSWPVHESEDWLRLKKNAEAWRALCDDLLNPDPVNRPGLNEVRARVTSLAPSQLPTPSIWRLRYLVRRLFTQNTAAISPLLPIAKTIIADPKPPKPAAELGQVLPDISAPPDDTSIDSPRLVRVSRGQLYAAAISVTLIASIIAAIFAFQNRHFIAPIARQSPHLNPPDVSASSGTKSAPTSAPSSDQSIGNARSREPVTRPNESLRLAKTSAEESRRANPPIIDNTTQPVIPSTDPSPKFVFESIAPIVRLSSVDHPADAVKQSINLTDMIQNADFEARLGPQGVTGWTVAAQAAGIRPLIQANTNLSSAQHGDFALQLNAETPSKQHGTVIQTLQTHFMPGPYELTVEIGVPGRITHTLTRSLISISLCDGTDSHPIASANGWGATDGMWHPVTLKHVVPANAAYVGHPIMIHLGHLGSGELLCDNIKLSGPNPFVDVSNAVSKPSLTSPATRPALPSLAQIRNRRDAAKRQVSNAIAAHLDDIERDPRVSTLEIRLHMLNERYAAINAASKRDLSALRPLNRELDEINAQLKTTRIAVVNEFPDVIAAKSTLDWATIEYSKAFHLPGSTVEADTNVGTAISGFAHDVNIAFGSGELAGGPIDATFDKVLSHRFRLEAASVWIVSEPSPENNGSIFDAAPVGKVILVKFQLPYPATFMPTHSGDASQPAQPAAELYLLASEQMLASARPNQNLSGYVTFTRAEIDPIAFETPDRRMVYVDRVRLLAEFIPDVSPIPTAGAARATADTGQKRFPISPITVTPEMSRFWFDYRIPSDPSRRSWRRVDDLHWEERFASGRIAQFLVSGTLGDSVIVTRLPDMQLRILIPPISDGAIIKYWESNSRHWLGLGPIHPEND
jgi:hypothetical protein